MELLNELRQSGKKGKVLVEHLARLILKDTAVLKSLADSLANAKPPERGSCMEAMEYASKEDPEVAKGHIATVAGYLTDKAPKVKWEAARVLGNVALRFPDEVAKAIDRLLTNTKDPGTVVRWSAAYALTELAKANEKVRTGLLKKVEQILKTEKNSGVRNVYLKTLKALDKETR